MANFITCYDKDLQDLADFLKILVSANDSINNLDFRIKILYLKNMFYT